MQDIDQLFFSRLNSHFNIKDNVVDGLKRLGILNLRDLLFYRPISYQFKTIAPNLSALQNGQLIQADIEITDLLAPSTRKQPLKILASNSSGNILLIFFHRPPIFMMNKLQIGSKHTIQKGPYNIFIIIFNSY